MMFWAPLLSTASAAGRTARVLQRSMTSTICAGVPVRPTITVLLRRETASRRAALRTLWLAWLQSSARRHGRLLIAAPVEVGGLYTANQGALAFIIVAFVAARQTTRSRPRFLGSIGKKGSTKEAEPPPSPHSRRRRPAWRRRGRAIPRIAANARRVRSDSTGPGLHTKTQAAALGDVDASEPLVVGSGRAKARASHGRLRHGRVRSDGLHPSYVRPV